MDDPARFGIPSHPDRRFRPGGGLSYVGGTVFSCRPVPAAAAEGAAPDRRGLVETVLGRGPYRSRPVNALPQPLWLVSDRETGDAFRVSLGAGAIRLHVLPTTSSTALQSFFDRLRSVSACRWEVERTVTED